MSRRPVPLDAGGVAEEVLGFWFGDPPLAPNPRLWWGGEKNDAEIKRRFGSAVDAALAGDYDSWQASARPALALILLLDQMTRNVHRGTARAFAGDPQALRVTRRGLDRGWVDRLHPFEGFFFIMPLEHHEDLASQDRCIAEIERLIERADPADRTGLQGNLDYAHQHREIIVRFGRYPHRNAILGRPSTPAEAQYLAAGGRRFGQ